MNIMATKQTVFSKANRSFRWTALAEISAKLIAPLMNMVLARFISSEIFGIVATLTVVTGLATTLSESGFARYIQQHQFQSEEEKKKACRTSLTSSLVFGLLLFAAIAIWRMPVSSLIGSSGYEMYLVLAAGSIPFHAVIAVETSILKRDFKFRLTSLVRVGSALLTAGVEIGLAVMGHGLIALSVGGLVSSAVLAVILFFFLDDKRIFGFSWKAFKESFSANFFFLLEGLCIWLASALDVLLLGSAFGDSLVGTYKLAFTTEKGIVALLGAIFSPVLISLISKFQQDDPEFKASLMRYQKAVSFLAFPVGIGMFVFRDGITRILLGSGWEAAIPIFGYFALVDCIKIAISDYISSMMNGRGKPYGSVLAQIPFLVCIVLCCVFARELGFETFTILRAGCTLVLILSYTLLCKPVLSVSPWRFYIGLVPPLIGSLIMAAACLPATMLSAGIPMTLLGVLIGFVVYLSAMRLLFPQYFANFLAILLDRDVSEETMTVPKVEQRLSKSKKIWRFKGPIKVSFFALVATCLCVPAALSFSTAASSYVPLQESSLSFDICNAANRNGGEKVSLLEYVPVGATYENGRKILNSTRAFTNFRSDWPDLFNFFLSPIDSEEFIAIDEGGIQRSIAPLSLMTSHIVNYDFDSSGHPRFETAGLFAMFLPSETGIPFTSSNIFISQGLADKILHGSQDYRSVLGKTIHYQDKNYTIANIIVDTKDSWFYTVLSTIYGDFGCVTDYSRLENGCGFFGAFTNQPFALKDYLEYGVSRCFDNIQNTNVYLSGPGGRWDWSAEKSISYDGLRIQVFQGHKFSWTGKTAAACALFFVLLGGEIAFLLLALKKLKYGNMPWTHALSISSFGFVGCGIVCIGASLITRYYYRFWLYYAFSLGLFAIGISLLIFAVLLVLGRRKRESIHESI